MSVTDFMVFKLQFHIVYESTSDSIYIKAVALCITQVPSNKNNNLCLGLEFQEKIVIFILSIYKYSDLHNEDLDDRQTPLAGGINGEEIDVEANFRLYEGHIPTSCLQKTLLAAGSAVTALYDPSRHGK